MIWQRSRSTRQTSLRQRSFLIPIGFGISGTVGVVALNLVLGGLIGGVILIWKLAVALWYLPLTIYRLVI